MKKAMISQAMAGLNESQILETKNKATQKIEELGYEVHNTYFTDEWTQSEILEDTGFTNKPLFFLAKSLEGMSKCEAVFFCKGWENSRGCKLEQAAAKAYHLTLIYEKD